LSKIFFKKGNFNTKISQAKKIPKKSQIFEKLAKKIHTKKRKNSVEFALIFFSKNICQSFRPRKK